MKDFNKALIPQTSLVLSALSEIEELNNFTLVGGSALSIYLNHRYSEDLDFFSWLPNLNDARINGLLNLISGKHNLKTLNTYSNGIDVLIDNVKVTFFANNWNELKNRDGLVNNSFIAKKQLLTAMKVNTLSLRAKYRDYYDLYVIANEVYDMQKIFEISLKLLPGMTKKIFAMQMIYIEDIDDENIAHLNPKYNISLDEIRIYFEKQIEKLL